VWVQNKHPSLLLLLGLLLSLCLNFLVLYSSSGFVVISSSFLKGRLSGQKVEREQQESHEKRRENEGKPRRRARQVQDMYFLFFSLLP